MPQRKINKAPSKYSSRTKAERWGVNKRKRVDTLPLLITGCGRSGTRHMSKMLNHAGAKVGHEVVREQGVVSWYFVKDADWYPYHPWDPTRIHVGERKSDFSFETTLHQVRHPLKVIASMMMIHQVLDYEWCFENGLIPSMSIPKLHKCMFMWTNINTAAQAEASYTYRLEDVTTRKVWRRISKSLGLPKMDPPVLKPSNRATGYKTPKILTWNDLNNVDIKLSLTIERMARKYGY